MFKASRFAGWPDVASNALVSELRPNGTLLKQKEKKHTYTSFELGRMTIKNEVLNLNQLTEVDIFYLASSDFAFQKFSFVP
jgi:phage antirepressor YoqD-like protein